MQRRPSHAPMQPPVPALSMMPSPEQSPRPEDAQLDSPFVLYYFYSPNCRFSQQFSPAWSTVANKLQSINLVSPRAIDASKQENEHLAFYYNVRGYPTVILVTPDKHIEYSGDRSPDDLYRFVASAVNNYAPRN